MAATLCQGGWRKVVNKIAFNSALPGRGKAMASRIFSVAVTQTRRSKPRPPACGVEPYRRRSRYHQSSSLSPNSLSFSQRTSRRSSRLS
eukprot:31487_2